MDTVLKHCHVRLKIISNPQHDQKLRTKHGQKHRNISVEPFIIPPLHQQVRHHPVQRDPPSIANQSPLGIFFVQTLSQPRGLRVHHNERQHLENPIVFRCSQLRIVRIQVRKISRRRVLRIPVAQ